MSQVWYWQKVPRERLTSPIHILGTINRINIHRGPGRGQITLLSVEEEGTWGPALLLLLLQGQGTPRSHHIKS